MSIRSVLMGRPGPSQDVRGDALFQSYDEESRVSVTRVLPGFIADLAALPADPTGQVAGRWHRSESMTDWALDDEARVLSERVEFARRAGEEGNPVLQLSVWSHRARSSVSPAGIVIKVDRVSGPTGLYRPAANNPRSVRVTSPL